MFVCIQPNSLQTIIYKKQKRLFATTNQNQAMQSACSSYSRFLNLNFERLLNDKRGYQNQQLLGYQKTTTKKIKRLSKKQPIEL